MNNLTTTTFTETINTNLTPIELALGVDDEGKTTARKLYEFLELNLSNYASWAKRNITENEFAEENTDYISFVVNDERNPKPTTDYKLSASFAKKLAMGTHNEKGEAAKKYFIRIEDKLKQKVIDTSQLSAETQLLLKLSQSIANSEIEQRKLHQEVTETKEELQGIRETIEIRPSQSWREETNALVKKICFKLKDYQLPKDEIYKALQERAGCDLKVRLKNMRGRLALEGATKSKLNNLNYLDVISEDKKLVEIYTAIVKEMAIKHNVAREAN